MGSIAGIFGFGAVLLGAFCFGLRGGLLAALTQLALNATVMQVIIQPAVPIDGSSAVGILFYFVAGAVVGNQRDLSRKLHAELRLNERLRVRERETLAAIPDALIRMDANGECSFQPELGPKPLAQVLERVLGQPLPPDGLAMVNGIVAHVRTAAVAQGLTLELSGPTFFEVRVLPAAESSILVVVRDVTEQRRLISRVTSAENLASLGTLAAGLAHEINNPLTYVITSLTSAGQSLDVQVENLKPELDTALDGCWRIRDIVANILETTTSKRDVLEAVLVPDAIRAAITLVATQVRHRATTMVKCDEDVYALAHRTKLMQVVVNLVANASQAFADTRITANKIQVRCYGEKDTVVIEVQDNGSGMDEATRRRALEPFFTTKEPGKGTGLGLFLSNSIVESLGGSLQIDSELGQGTKVTLRLLRCAEPSFVGQIACREVPPVNATSPRLRILIIDDEPCIRRALQRLLGSRHDVALSNNGAEALHRFVVGERYDVILSDVLMPEMTGIELFAELEQRFPEQSKRVVFMTGGATSESARVFIEEKRARVVAKPFRAKDIESTVCAFAQLS